MFFNKNYKPLLIAEIGLNHMGKKKYLYKYIDELEKKKLMELQSRYLEINSI